jgi:hypothetical protein
MQLNFVTNNGYNTDIWGTGALTLTICVYIANFKILTFSYIQNLTGAIIMFLSICLYVLSFAFANFLQSSDLYDSFKE